MGEDENPFSDPPERPSRDKHSQGKPTGESNERLGIEPYHPGFKETRSYVGRQDSAVDHTTMHAAGTGEIERPFGGERRRDERRREEEEAESRNTKPTVSAYRY
jgi:hypothetical protein